MVRRIDSLKVRIERFSLIVLFVCGAGLRAEFETPLAITNVKIITGTGTNFESGTILIAKGRIVDAGANVEIPAHAERFDASGLIAYPGFIDAQVHLGIPESVRTSEERQRAEDVNPDHREDPLPAMHLANRRGVRPQIRAVERFAPDAKAVESHRAAGFTAALIAPRDGILAGTSDLVNLSGEPIRRSILAGNVGMHASFEAGEQGEYPQTLLGVFAVYRQVLLDARWYAKMQKFVQRRPDQAPRAPADPALDALQPVLARTQRVFFEANSAKEIHRALDLCREFNLDVVITGGREAWKAADRLKAERVPVIASLKFDQEPEYGKKKPARPGPGGESATKEGKEEEKKKEERIYEPLKVRQERRRLWEEQVHNVIRLQEVGIPFALRTRDFKTLDEFFKNLRMVMERGFDEEAAIAALSSTPADLFGLKGRLGTIAPAQLANLTLRSKSIAEEKSLTRFVFIDGKKFVIDSEEPKPGETTRDGAAPEKPTTEEGESPTTEKSDQPPAEPEADRGPSFVAEIKADRIPKTKTGGNVLIQNATVIPISSPSQDNASVLILDGKIATVGRDLVAPAGVTVIDATGRFVMPGIVDCHSHLGLDAVNESPLAISAEVRIADVIDPESVAIYRAAAGGATTHHAMHGSANPIGGQNVILKLKYGRPASELLFRDGPRTIKFALGENVTQANFPSAWGKRFPNTRMGVEATLRLAFDRARVYQSEWDGFQKKSQAGEDLPPLRRDLRLEALAEVLAGRMAVHCHCYRSEEILRLFEVAEEYGIRIGTLHHVLEGYRIAPEIARHGSGASTFANLWAYKVEAYGAIPYNAAMMTRYGINSSVNSDSANTIRYLNQEAAKCIRWGDLDELEALRLVTLNSAMQLQIDDRVGSLEAGKDGDVAIYDGHPLNTFSRCVMTLIDGEVFFEDPRLQPETERRMPVAGGLELPAKPLAARPTISETVHRAIAITNVTIHAMTSVSGDDVIENGTVVIVKDKIHAVGGGVNIPPGAGILDAKGLHVYPGLIDGGTSLGLDEIGALRATQDQREIGSFNPHLLASTAVHPHSEHIRISRAAGITSCMIRPGGGRISGQSAIAHLDGWTAAEMLLADRFALYMSVPSLPVHLATDPEAKKKQNEEHKNAVKELEEFLAKAKHYVKVKELTATNGAIEFETDLSLESMAPYVRGEKPVVFTASTYKEILDALEFAEKHKLSMILSGGAEAWKLASVLAERQIPVILSSPTTYLSGEFEPWDSVYRCAGELARAGVRFCFASSSAADAYNLGIEAGMAVAHGLPLAHAEYALTRGAADILGLAERRGSIEVGKQADLIVTTDSPLQAISEVTHVFIDGRAIDLTNLHTQNYEKFKNRPFPRLPPTRELRGPPSLTARGRP